MAEDFREGTTNGGFGALRRRIDDQHLRTALGRVRQPLGP